MSAIETARQALRDWDRHRRELATLSDTRDGDWRKRTVEYRRLLQTDIARIAGAIGELAENDDPQSDGRQLRSELSALRSCVAEHQANWPVIAIDPTDAGYEKSVVNLRAANDRFAATSVTLLDRIARG